MKTKIFALILISIFSVSACYNASESSDSKTPRRTDRSSPVTEKSTSPEPSQTAENKGNFGQAKSDYDAKNYEKAASGFQDVIDSDLNNFEARFYLGKSQQALKKDDGAISAFKEVVKIKPEHADANFELGNIYYGRKDYDTALPFYQRAVKTNFRDPKMLMALGDNYSAMKKDDYAIVQYLKVEEFDKTNADAIYKTGLAYITIGNSIAARQTAQRLEKVDSAKAKKLLESVDKMK